MRNFNKLNQFTSIYLKISVCHFHFALYTGWQEIIMSKHWETDSERYSTTDLIAGHLEFATLSQVSTNHVHFVMKQGAACEEFTKRWRKLYWHCYQKTDFRLIERKEWKSKIHHSRNKDYAHRCHLRGYRLGPRLQPTSASTKSWTPGVQLQRPKAKSPATERATPHHWIKYAVTTKMTNEKSEDIVQKFTKINAQYLLDEKNCQEKKSNERPRK